MKKTVTLILVIAFALMASNAFGLQDISEFSFKNSNSKVLDLNINQAVPGVPGMVAREDYPIYVAAPAIVTAYPTPYGASMVARGEVPVPKSIQTTLTANSIQTTLTANQHPCPY